jgi:hypothetical protein
MQCNVSAGSSTLVKKKIAIDYLTIAQRAYFKWVAGGMQPHRDIKDWLEAERELQLEWAEAQIKVLAYNQYLHYDKVHGYHETDWNVAQKAFWAQYAMPI